MKNGTWIYSIIFIVISGTFSDSCKKKEASLPEIITKEATLTYDDDRIIYVTGGTLFLMMATRMVLMPIQTVNSQCLSL
jgi:hypothetical protein